MPFSLSELLSEIPRTTEDKAFVTIKMEIGCAGRTIEETTENYTIDCLDRGCIASSLFVAWHGEADETKGWFVLVLNK